MGMDLYNGNGDYFRFSIRAWRHILVLAQTSGWEPAGTTHPDPEWSNSYVANNAQQVTTVDAANMANALRDALDDIPGINAINWEKRQGDPLFDSEVKAETLEDAFAAMAEIFVETYTAETTFPDAVEFFSGDSKQKVIDFIVFCERGAFTIH